MTQQQPQQRGVAEQLTCAGCGKPLLAENCWMDDGCPCNTPRGVNDGNQQISEWRREREQKASYEAERWRDVAKRFWRHLDTYGVVAEIRSGIHIPLSASDPEWRSQDECFRAYHDMVLDVTNTKATP